MKTDRLASRYKVGRLQQILFEDKNRKIKKSTSIWFNALNARRVDRSMKERFLRDILVEEHVTVLCKLCNKITKQKKTGKNINPTVWLSHNLVTRSHWIPRIRVARTALDREGSWYETTCYIHICASLN